MRYSGGRSKLYCKSAVVGPRRPGKVTRVVCMLRIYSSNKYKKEVFEDVCTTLLERTLSELVHSLPRPSATHSLTTLDTRPQSHTLTHKLLERIRTKHFSFMVIRFTCASLFTFPRSYRLSSFFSPAPHHSH